LLPSRPAAMRHISANFDLYRTRLRSILESSISVVHFSSDLWTSPHRHGILALCARWVDADLKPRRALLGMPECRVSHSGEHQAKLMLEVLEIYDLPRRLGYHTSDNATSNDTCLKHLSRLLKEKHNVRVGLIFSHFGFGLNLPCIRSTLIQSNAVFAAWHIFSISPCRLSFWPPRKRP
jgi:hypothetical protein